MKPEAASKARQRLERAEHALGTIRSVLNFEGFESLWSDFLIAGNGVHTALERGSRDSAQSRQWFGGKKRERRLDPLLNYMHQARNADEHGLQPVALPGAPEIRGLEAFERGVLIGDTFRTREGIFGLFSTAEQAAVTFQITPPAAMLVPVHHEVYGQTFDPPTEHRGKALKA